MLYSTHSSGSGSTKHCRFNTVMESFVQGASETSWWRHDYEMRTSCRKWNVLTFSSHAQWVVAVLSHLYDDVSIRLKLLRVRTRLSWWWRHKLKTHAHTWYQRPTYLMTSNSSTVSGGSSCAFRVAKQQRAKTEKKKLFIFKYLSILTIIFLDFLTVMGLFLVLYAFPILLITEVQGRFCVNELPSLWENRNWSVEMIAFWTTSRDTTRDVVTSFVTQTWVLSMFCYVIEQRSII